MMITSRPSGITPHAAQQSPIRAGVGNDVDAAGPLDHGDRIRPALLDVDVAGTYAETLDLVVADEHVAVFLHDGPARLLNDRAATFVHLVAFRVQVLDLA